MSLFSTEKLVSPSHCNDTALQSYSQPTSSPLAEPLTPPIVQNFSLTQKKTQSDRQSGIDLMRILASFHVICAHATGIVALYPDAGYTLRLLLESAVPFFLLVSFYYLTHSLSTRPLDEGSTVLRKRLSRLIPTYIFWSIVYFALRLTLYIVKQQKQKTHDLLGDPLGALFFGSSAVHLYFIPLLIVGQIILFILLSRLRSLTNANIFIAFVLASVLRSWSQVTGNSFNLKTGIAFTNLIESLKLDTNFWPLRLVSVAVSFSITCLPLLILAVILYRFIPHLKITLPIRLCIQSFTLIIILVSHLLPAFMKWEVISLATFLFGFWLPIPRTRFMVLCGTYSFSIYLMHDFVLEIVTFFVACLRITTPASATIVYTGSVGLIFIICFILADFVAKQVRILRTPFGITT